MKVKSGREVAQSCPTLGDPMDCSPPGSSVHGVFQAGALEWGATATVAYSLFCCCLVTKLCLTLCDPMDCSLPSSSVHGIFQARVLEWGAIAFSRGSSQPRDRSCVFFIAGRFFTTEPPGKASLFTLNSRLLPLPFLILLTASICHLLIKIQGFKTDFSIKESTARLEQVGGFSGGPVFNSPPYSAGDVVQSLVWEDFTCRGATRSMYHNYWGPTLQLESSWATVKDPAWCNEGPACCN